MWLIHPYKINPQLFKILLLGIIQVSLAIIGEIKLRKFDILQIVMLMIYVYIKSFMMAE